MTSQEDLEKILAAPENEHLEFKEAKNNFCFEELIKYCCALSNERGGKIVLGITNTPPRRVVGTTVFKGLQETQKSLFDHLHLRIEAEEVLHPHGRVIIFNVPSRSIGIPVQYKGTYYMRIGDALQGMTPEMLRSIFSEASPDFSAEVCPDASLEDLDLKAIDIFQRRWSRKADNANLLTLSPAQILNDSELMAGERPTYAALILLGTHKALGKYLPQAELIFEYRSNEAELRSNRRLEFREGFLLWMDALWDEINKRNDLQHYQDGLFLWDIPTFREEVIREGILNAVCHRDYRNESSIFIRQFPRTMEIVSPGGFLEGITPENIIWRQKPRNRRLAEVFSRCGLVERSGQGMDMIYRQCIRESKSLPDFSNTDGYQVSLTLRGDVQNPEFLLFLEQVGKETLSTFITDDLLLLDYIHREQPIPEHVKDRIGVLSEMGIIERVGKGRGTRYILSHRFYRFLGKKAVYTRKKRLDRHTNKELLYLHIKKNAGDGVKLEELTQVLPSEKPRYIQWLLRELKNEGRICITGRTRSAKWFPIIKSH